MYTMLQKETVTLKKWREKNKGLSQAED
uniref:Uncharacterized protein n=1 Tax=Anguilla anguilla TaxID=7936 RepID=A0A0E9QC38_ANGAN